MAKMTAAQAAVLVMEKEGVTQAFGVPGAAINPLYAALRTVLAAKSINMISAVVLFVLAVGNVRGFALTLGLTVIIDVIVVVLFTHPMLQLLAQTRFFSGGHPLSGLDPKALGAVYRGHGYTVGISANDGDVTYVVSPTPGA